MCFCLDLCDLFSRVFHFPSFLRYQAWETVRTRKRASISWQPVSTTRQPNQLGTLLLGSFLPVGCQPVISKSTKNNFFLADTHTPGKKDKIVDVRFRNCATCSPNTYGGGRWICFVFGDIYIFFK